MKVTKKIISIILSVIMLVTSSSIAFFAYAVDDFSTGFDLQIYYYDDESNFVEVTDQLQVMEQYDIQLYACLVYGDGTVWNITSSGMPVDLDGYTIDWTSDARYLAFCEKNDGKIHGYDATKGEAIRNWLDNEIGGIPVIGGALKKALLALLDNGVTDIDNLDTADVQKALDTALKTVNVDEETREKLMKSVGDYLDKFDVGISATLKDPNGKAVASDTVRVLVTKSDKLLSDVVPNAAFIKNYDSIPRTVAVGYEMDLDGIITPVRTHYKCEWTVTGQAGILGSDLAEVDENGHFTAKQEGTVQIKVSPDIKGLTEKLRNAFEALSKAGDLVDSETLAKAILLILGIPSNSDNYTTLVNIIARIADSGVIDEDGSMRFTDEIMTPLANFILYVIYQDSVTIKIVSPDAIPITSYDLDFDDEITEGESTNIKFTNVKPDGAVAHDYKVSIDNEEYAVFTDALTVLGIDGSTWNNNYVTPNKTNIVCNMDSVEKKKELKVYGKNNKKVVYIKIGCNEYLDIGVPTPVNPTTYPKRLTPSLQYGWVMSDGTYRFATADTPAYTEDGQAYVTSEGILYSTGCTVNDVIVMDNDGAFQTKQIMSGIQTTGVSFTKKHFWKKSTSGTISTGIRGSVCEVSAYLTPADASFNKLTFTSKNTETVILSDSPLTTAQYASAVLTEERRKSHATVSVNADENGYATVYAYAVGNDSCYADVTVESQTGGFVDDATVAYANIDVVSVEITAKEDDDYLQDDGSYLITAGDTVNFESHVRMSATGSWKNQGFEDVEWSVSDENIATVSSAGVLVGRDVGTVTVTALSVFGEIEGKVSVKVLPDYRALKAAMAETDYENLDPYDWSEASWEVFDAYYQEAVQKLGDNSFVSQKEVDKLAEDISNSFHSLVRYIPLTGLDIACSDDADGNGFATVDVPTLRDYTAYSTTIVPTIYPEGAEYYHLSFKSSNESKLKVTNDGVCYPASNDAAWAKVTVTVVDPKNGNSFSKDMYVAFSKYQVESVTVDPTVINFVGIGEDAETTSATISATYNTSSRTTSASIKAGFFVSSDTSVATVDANSGVVTPVGIGNCTITCYSYDGGYTGVTTVNVTTNKNKLRTAIDKANALVEEFYTEDSYAAVMSALADARAIYDNADSIQADINAITATLNDALNSLVRNPYANVYLTAGNGGAILYDGITYTGENNKVRVLIEDGLSVTAVANDGYHFTRWVDGNGNTISTNPSEKFDIDYSADFKAEFTEVHAVTGVKIFADGNDTEYYTVGVGALANYKNQSAQLSYQITPANANFYTVEYRTTSTTVDVASNGKISPNDNSTCYAVIDVVVTNTITGVQFVDTVTVAFVKYKLASVTPSPSSISFDGVNAASQTIAINYASSSSQTPSLRKGFFESDNTSIAIVDSNGVVSPMGIGTCRIKFTAYDGGYTCYVNVSVYADKSALHTIIDTADKLISRNYTDDSYNAMIAVKDNAKLVEAEQFASQQDVDNATSALQQAINNLVKLDLADVEITIEGKGSVKLDLDDKVFTESGVFTVRNGDNLLLTADAEEGYEFAGWYNADGNQISTGKTLVLNADGTTFITAKFNKIIFVESVELTYDGKVGDFAQKDVSTLKRYTDYSFEMGVQVNPSNATRYTYSISLDSSAVNLKLDGNKVTPVENKFAYGYVNLTVLDQMSGRSFHDRIMVSFANYTVVSVSLDKSSVVFYGENDSSANVNVSYKADSRNANIQFGYVTVEDSSIADAYMSNGSTIVVTPKHIGATTATFTSTDGGKTASFTITVYADKSSLESALNQIKALNPDDYTQDSFVAVQPVIDYAQGVYDNEFASQKDVDDAVSAIASVISSLVMRDEITIKASTLGNGKATINGEAHSSVTVSRWQQITVSAVADDGYMLDAWYNENGAVVSRDANYTFTATNAATLIAKFKPIPYITRVVATYDGKETDFARVSVSTLQRYTSQSASFDVKVYPSDADYTLVGYSLGTPASNLSLSGNTVKPSANNPAYGEVVVTVRDNISGKTHTDTIYVSFVKNAVSSVSVSPTSLTFDSAQAPSKTITPSYSGSSANVKDGFFVSNDESVATVTRNGVVTPVSKGTCKIVFYSYDGGLSATADVTVNGPDFVAVSGKVVAMDTYSNDSGTIPLDGATVTIGDKAATTSTDGSFVIGGLNPSKTYNATVEYKYGITRTVTITVGTGDKQCANIPIIAVDYDKNGYINARDYLVMKKLGIDNKKMFSEFYSPNPYTDTTYFEMSL